MENDGLKAYANAGYESFAFSELALELDPDSAEAHGAIALAVGSRERPDQSVRRRQAWRDAGRDDEALHHLAEAPRNCPRNSLIQHNADLVARHKRKILVESKAGRGTTLSFTIPVAGTIPEPGKHGRTHM
jgi:hypothetical protein